MNDARILRGCWDSFISGLTQPSRTALLVIFTVNVFAFCGLCLFITPDLVAGPVHRYLMENPQDSFVPVTAKAFQAQRLKSPKIVILGDSVTVRCISSEQRLADMISGQLGSAAPAVYNMSADGQVSLEMAALAELLPEEFSGVVVLGIGAPFLSNEMGKLAKDILEVPKIGFSAEVVDNVAKTFGVPVPYRTGNYFVDNWRFFLSRFRFAIRNWVISGPQPYGDAFDVSWMNEGKEDLSDQESRDYYVSEVGRLYGPNRIDNLEVVGKTVEKLKKRGKVSFILLQPPINPFWYSDPWGKEFFEGYTNDLRQFATRYGMSFLSANQAAGLSSADFFDYGGQRTDY